MTSKKGLPFPVDDPSAVLAWSKNVVENALMEIEHAQNLKTISVIKEKVKKLNP